MENNNTQEFILSFKEIDKRIKSASPKCSPSLASEIFYYLLLTSSILIQYFNIFKINIVDYNLKIICYSLLILMFRLSKHILKYTRMVDPINEYGFEDIAHTAHYLSFIVPVLMMWDLFEDFSTIKIALIVYYYVLNFVLYLTKDTNRKRSISLVQEFKYELRTVSARLIEVIYFIFFLPMATRTDKIIETQTSLFMSYEMAFCCMINMSFYLLFNCLMKNINDWKLYAKMNGFWREITLLSKRSKAIPFTLKNANYSKGSVVTHDQKFYEFIGFKPNKKFKYFDQLVYDLVTKDKILKYMLLCSFNMWIIMQVGLMISFFAGFSTFFQTAHLLATLGSCYIMDKINN